MPAGSTCRHTTAQTADGAAKHRSGIYSPMKYILAESGFRAKYIPVSIHPSSQNLSSVKCRNFFKNANLPLPAHFHPGLCCPVCSSAVNAVHAITADMDIIIAAVKRNATPGSVMILSATEKSGASLNWILSSQILSAK